MVIAFDGIIDRFDLAGTGFELKLRAVRPEQWTWSTPCADWNVRQLVNHVTRGNLNYVRLLDGGAAEDFLRLRDADALGADPVDAFVRSARECADAFARPGALRQVLDYPLGKVVGAQALSIRATDTTIHTWDLARAIHVDETLDASQVLWISDHLDDIYAGLPETPIDAGSSHRFFAAADGALATDASDQDRLLWRMGRKP